MQFKSAKFASVRHVACVNQQDTCTVPPLLVAPLFTEPGASCSPTFPANNMPRYSLLRGAAALAIIFAVCFDQAEAFLTSLPSATRAPPDAVNCCPSKPVLDLHFSSSSSSALSMVQNNGVGPDPYRNLQYDITFVQGPQDFLDFLARDDRLCVIFVRASWCQICKQFSTKWRKMANAYGDKYDPNTGELVVLGSIRFAEIEFTEHEDLCRRLGASRLPHVLFYQGAAGMAGKITQYQCGPSAFGLVVDSAEYLLAGPPQGVSPPWAEFVAAQEQMLREKAEREQGGQQ